MQTRFSGVWRGVILAGLSLACSTPRSAAQEQTTCIVERVVDGDTFRCRNGLRVRLIGIDSPEYEQRPYGSEARDALSHWLSPGILVRLESDVVPTDPYGRLLAYVWSGPDLVNEAMVRDGWAVLYTVPPNVKYAGRLEHAQKKARAGGAGLWSQQGFECLPSDYRRQRCISRP